MVGSVPFDPSIHQPKPPSPDSEERFSRFIQQSRDGFMEVTPDGRVTLVNQAALDLFEMPREEVEGHVFEFPSIEDEQERAARRERLGRDGFLQNERVTVRTASGTKVLNETMWLIRDANGELTHAQMVFRDVSSRVQVEKELAERNEELRMLNRIGLILAQPVSTLVSLEKVCEEIGTLTRMQTVAILSLDRETQHLEVVGQFNVPPFLTRPFEQMPRGAQDSRENGDPRLRNMLEALLQRKEPLVFPGPDQSTPSADSPMGMAGFRSGIAAPLRFRDEPYGLLLIGSREPRAFGDSDSTLVQNIALRLALSLRNLQLWRQMRGQLRELEALAEVGRLLDDGGGSPESLMPITGKMRETLGADRVTVYLFTREGLKLQAWSGEVGEEIAPIVNYPSERLTSRESTIVPDVGASDLDPSIRQLLVAAGIRAFVSVPLVSERKVLGLLFAEQFEPRDWTSEDVRLVATFGSQISSHLYNHQLLKEAQIRLKELEAVAETSVLAASLIEEDQLLDLALDQVTGLLGVPLAGFHMLRDGQFQLVKSRGSVPLPAYSFYMTRTLREVLDSRRPLVYDASRPAELDPEVGAAPTEYGIGAFVIAPLFTPNLNLGLMSLGWQEEHVWTDEEIRVIQAIANQMATGIANARLYNSLKEERNRLETTLNSVFSGVFTTDANGTIESWNRAAEEITGLSQAQVLGKNWTRDLAHVSGAPDELIFEAMEEGETIFGLASRVLKGKDGKEIPLEEAASPLRDADSHIRGAVGAFWDRSRERQAEQARLDFLDEVTHETRNALTVVISMADMLQKPDVTGATREEAIRVMGRQLQRLHDFSRRFLGFEREQLQRPAEKDVIDVSELLREQLEPMRFKYPEVRFVLKAHPAPAQADRKRLQTVLVNLLDNTAKFSPPGGTVSVECREQRDRVGVSISNEGDCIDPAIQPRLLERGFRGPGSERVPGTGIGLWLVETKLREMESTLEISSGKERGACFSFSLPGARKRNESEAENPARGRRPGHRRRSGTAAGA